MIGVDDWRRIERELIGNDALVDLAPRREPKRHAPHLVGRDPLTGVCDRRRLFLEFDRILESAAHSGRSGAVLVIDVDHFNLTNRTYGHLAGDHLLITVGRVLSARLGEADILARMGGDEFVLVLPEADERRATRLALELRALLCERMTGPPVRVSIGIALFGGHERCSVDDMLVAADSAMFQAKRAGGDQAAVYPGHASRLTQRARALRAALDERRFVLHAQPILDLRSGRVASCELLIRMVSESGEIIAPGEFLPVAERMSLVTEVDRWVLSEAIALAGQGSVAVNLSARSLGDPRITAAIRAAIADGLDPGNLTFELTETAVMTDFENALEFVSSLTALGCDLALDDFGTGFGSFTYLKHLPARYLKLDMEFVRDINTETSDREIVRSIVMVAHTLGKQTIAEGVEHAEVVQTLRELGVDYVQGFHVGRPVPLGEAEAPRDLAAA
jgi:diguanylate cyclase (GGDEF)-like protein